MRVALSLSFPLFSLRRWNEIFQAYRMSVGKGIMQDDIFSLRGMLMDFEQVVALLCCLPFVSQEFFSPEFSAASDISCSLLV
jgi:hypothetical protein